MLKMVSLPLGFQTRQLCNLLYIYTPTNTHKFYELQTNFCKNLCKFRGPVTSVGTVTELRAERSGIESRWRRDFSPVQTDPGARPASCKMGTGSFSGVKCGRGVLLTTHPLLVSRSCKSRAIPLPALWATPGL